MPERLPTLSVIAGAVAVGTSVVAAAATASGAAPGSPLTWMTILFGVAGGVVALLRPDRMWALAVADTLVATAVVASMFGLGLFELVPLMLLGMATVRTPHLPAGGVTPMASRERAAGEPQRRSA